jgi:4-alpha-glucanotransferase
MAHIDFKINYQTRWGEQLFITGNTPELGNGDHQNAIQMQHQGNGNWHATLDLNNESISFEYSYFIRENKLTTAHEWGQPHRFESTKNNDSYRLHDHWQGMPPNKPFFSSAFTGCLFARKNEKITALKNFEQSLTIKVFAPTIPPHLTLAVIGIAPN